MIQRNLKMKAVEPPPQLSMEDSHDALTDQYNWDNGYLPPTDDQSWRERAALGIAPGREPDREFENANRKLAPQIEDGEPDVREQGRGGLLVALGLAMILLPGIVLLTNPAMFTAGFWRAQQAALPQAPPAQDPVRQAPKLIPAFRATLREQAPQIRRQAAPTAEPDTQPQSQPPALANPSEAPLSTANAAPTDTVRDARGPGNSANDDGGGFYAKVMGPDGRLHVRFFPAAAPGTPRAAVPPEAGGFYAMVMEPDGSLRYRHFSSKPAQ